MIFRDKTTLFSKLFKVLYTCLYEQKTLKTSYMPNINLMLNIIHLFHILQTLLAVCRSPLSQQYSRMMTTAAFDDKAVQV